jgi:thiol-disulfide isomerase/thioredoxin
MNPQAHPLPRPGRTLRPLAILLAALLVLAACSAAATQAPAAPASQAGGLTVDDLPAGVGRGYPRAVLDDDAASAVAVGVAAPNFGMALDDGRTLALHDLRGRPVMLNFWATWCGPCRLEMPDIVRQSAANSELVVLAINSEEEMELIRPFAEEFGMELPVVRDEEGELHYRYAVFGMPTSVFIDRDGNIAASWTGLLTPALLEEMLAKIL